MFTRIHGKKLPLPHPLRLFALSKWRLGAARGWEKRCLVESEKSDVCTVWKTFQGVKVVACMSGQSGFMGQAYSDLFSSFTEQMHYCPFFKLSFSGFCFVCFSSFWILFRYRILSIFNCCFFRVFIGLGFNQDSFHSPAISLQFGSTFASHLLAWIRAF